MDKETAKYRNGIEYPFSHPFFSSKLMQNYQQSLRIQLLINR